MYLCLQILTSFWLCFQGLCMLCMRRRWTWRGSLGIALVPRARCLPIWPWTRPMRASVSLQETAWALACWMSADVNKVGSAWSSWSACHMSNCCSESEPSLFFNWILFVFRSSHHNVLTTLLPGRWEICSRCIWDEPGKGAAPDNDWYQPGRNIIQFLKILSRHVLQHLKCQ